MLRSPGLSQSGERTTAIRRAPDGQTNLTSPILLAASGGQTEKAFWRDEVKQAYETGVEHGRADAKIVTSMAYERHAEDIDRMFELYFSKGYEHR